MKLGIRAKLFLLILSMVALALVAAQVALLPALDRAWTERLRADLSIRTELVAREAASLAAPLDMLAAWDALADALATSALARVTFIRSDGRVLGDSELSLEDLERAPDHATRPEVLESMRLGHGEALRESATLRSRMLYMTAPFTHAGERAGTARLAISLAEIDRTLTHLTYLVLIGTLVALAIAALISGAVTHLISKRIWGMTRAARAMAEGALETRVQISGNDELAALGHSLHHLAENLSHALAVRRDFVANVSHELKTPIAGIRSAAETLANGALNDAVAAPRFLAIVEREATRLQSIVEELLELSQLESSHRALSRSPTPIRPLLSSLVTQYEPHAQRRYQRLVLSIGKDVDVLHTDRRALERALSNLLDNATKYADEGATITLSATRTDASVLFGVGDTGPGIEPAHLSRIFERFYRADIGRSRALGGTGLGLSLAKHLVESLGGHLEVESTVGLGTRFSFVLGNE